MKLKTSELTGAALNWAVAKAEGITCAVYSRETVVDEWTNPLEFHDDWGIAGPIIEREQIFVKPTAKLAKGWRTYQRDPAGNGICNSQYGPTPLIAAMRCFVASRLGDEVEVPQELV